jgi:hypothetical protein
MTERELQIRQAWAEARALVMVQSRAIRTLYDTSFESKSAWEHEVARMYTSNIRELGAEEKIKATREFLHTLSSLESVRDISLGAFFVAADNILQTFARKINLPTGLELKVGPSTNGITFSELAHAASADFRHYTVWKPAPKRRSPDMEVLIRFGVPEDMVNRNVCGLVMDLFKPLNGESLELALHHAVNEIGESGVKSLNASP